MSAKSIVVGHNDLQALKSKMTKKSLGALSALDNPKLIEFVCSAAALGEPKTIMVVTDDPKDIAAVRKLAVDNHEERELNTAGHTIHFDSYYDQARDPGNTRYLIEPGTDLGSRLRTRDKAEGLAEMGGFMQGAMKGRTMIVRFLSLGPAHSEWSLPAVQITDSAYVAHSESLLYRAGYKSFKAMGDSPRFFRFLHTAGRLEGDVCVDIDKRRIYIDLDEEIVYSVNTQYAGNTVGLKKLAFRLALRRAHAEGWLAEHMFVMGAHGKGGRVTYFTGAFPSACGKTSTAMLAGQTIVGDDLAYLRKRDGKVWATNVEAGIFGIIRDVNAEDDPVIWDVLNAPGEVIFSNVLVTDGVPTWLGDSREVPAQGVNHGGEWSPGAVGPDGKVVAQAHPNARYTVALKDLKNLDPDWDVPAGVPVSGVIFGGRDSDTWVPVEEAFDWTQGVVTKAATLESETTSATLGAEGQRKFDLMSLIDFLSMPMGQYLGNYLAFPAGLEDSPTVFSVNYFLREDGKYLNGMYDKAVWVAWMEERVHGEVEAIETPSGRIPLYEDLKRLFERVLDKAYTPEDYVKQFTIRVPENLAKLDRIEKIYEGEQLMPEVFFDTLRRQRRRFQELQIAKGDYVSPNDL